jgi:Flp pilus assembly pilin Flp
MNSVKLKRSAHLAQDTSGAAMIEFAIIAFLFFVLTGGLVDFALAIYQWNSASKAVQLGARLAAVSNPVSSDLKTLTGLEGGALPGEPFPAFVRVCSGASQSCSGGGAYDVAAMDTLVYGRGQTSCGTVGADQFAGMCDVFNRIQPQNVIVTYRQTGLGFAGRPGGPVPTITVELTGLTFDFVFLSSLLGAITMPAMKTTATGEDLSTTN